MHRTVWQISLMLAACGLSLTAQTPVPAPTASPAPLLTAAPVLHADMNQLMRGLLYPAANVVFFAQAEDPEESAKVLTGDPAMATDPIKSAFGGWQAVQNAALTLAESATLLTIEGRRCSNGVPAPVTDPSWSKFVQELRSASMNAYAAAQTKDQDTVFKASETLSANCTGCHRRWRDRRGEGRCR